MNQIEIYKHEVDYINKLPISDNAKKVLFTLLVKHKFGFHNLLNTKEMRDSVCTDYKRLWKEKFDEYMSELFKYKTDPKPSLLKPIDYDEKGFITFDKRMIEGASEIIITVTNHMKAGLYLDYYNHVPLVKLCDICNEPFKAGSGAAKHCDNCKATILADQKKKWDQQNR